MERVDAIDLESLVAERHHNSLEVVQRDHKHKMQAINKYQNQLFSMAKRKLRHIGARKLDSIALLGLVSLIISHQVALASASSHQQTSNSDTNEILQRSQPSQQVIQPRSGGLEPSDYVDEAGEMDILANQQQIPTAALMAAAGHVVPENFFLPGGSIPALYPSRLQQLLQQYQHVASQHHHQQQQQQQQQQPQHQHQHQQHQHMNAGQQQAASSPEAVIQSLNNLKQAAMKFGHLRSSDMLESASAQEPMSQHSADLLGPIIDFNTYHFGQPISDSASTSAGGSRAADVVDLIGGGPVASAAALSALHSPSAGLTYEQQQQLAEQQVAAELAAFAAASQREREREQNHQQQSSDNQAQASETSMAEQYGLGASHLGPAYQIAGAEMGGGPSLYHMPDRPYGLPTKSSNKKPSGMLEPMGNPKTISSPVIDFLATSVPKTSHMEKLVEKLPQPQTPTIFSFSSSKDPTEKAKAVGQKKRNVVRQAENFARMMIKSVNEKLGTNIGDQSDIPFLLSNIGPLGFAQNMLLDPTLLVTLLNSAEKGYMSDILPSPAKMAMRPVLNMFRVPNKKRDKANITNIISFLASGGQMPSPTPKHRQGTGIEKSTKSKNSR